MASCAIYCTAVLCVTLLLEHGCSMGTPIAMSALCCTNILSAQKQKCVSARCWRTDHCTRACSLQITSGYCPKTWEVSNSLTKTTAGNFCAGQKYSSMYSCAANCRYSSSQLEQAQCAGLPDKLSYTSGEQLLRVRNMHFRNHCHMPLIDGLIGSLTGVIA